MLQHRPLDLAFHALSDPTRRAMVERLTRGAASVSDLAAPLPMSMSAVVQHLKVLQEAGLVTSEKSGRIRTCRIDLHALSAAERWIAERRLSMEARLDRLGVFLEETKSETEPRK
ncbi:MAG TPA: metalloregulator ArsR/SmtB family transcription factor [Brevundimonas sp.]|jgi:DNA-binding transcriptional ArsR family regulator|uniref:ArsR/SmtB family transcription factor n=1 Tax=Brevundimonas sp. TaxID=1871086 RepID=UPI002DF1962D|nr:metalloregulator ArsR/SmtB family transcription factor [Brevundimonas sp.]